MSEIKKVPLNQISQYVIMKLGDYEIGVYRLESFSEIEEYKLQEGSWEVQFPFPNSEIKRKVIGFLNSCQTRPFSNHHYGPLDVMYLRGNKNAQIPEDIQEEIEEFLKTCC